MSKPYLCYRHVRNCLLIFLFAASNAVLAQGVWKPVTHAAPKHNDGPMLLLSDGTVIVKCSEPGAPGPYPDTTGRSWARLTPDIHGSYVNGTWDTIAPMRDSRRYFASQTLRDGRVYVAGGELGTGNSSAEVYNPVANHWDTIPRLFTSTSSYTMFDAMAEILPDGRVLQNLDYHTNYGLYVSNLLFDPATNTFSVADSCLRSQWEANWMKLPDNSLMTIDRNSLTTERYIPATGTWVNDANLADTLWDLTPEIGAGHVLPDGRLVVFGGNGKTGYYTPSGSAAPGSWASGPRAGLYATTPMNIWWGAPDAPSASMNNGKILCSMSPAWPWGGGFVVPTKFFEFDYLADTFIAVAAPDGSASLDMEAYNGVMLCLPDGSIMYGVNGSPQYYVYQPAGSSIIAGKPIIDKVIKQSCDTYMITGKLFNGISEGAMYGDDFQMCTNFPVVRLTSGANVYYARSYNWNRTGLMTGSLPDTAMFVLHTGMPTGWYNLQVIANGNASASWSFGTCGASHAGMPVAGSVQPGLFFATPNPSTLHTTVTYNAEATGMCEFHLLNALGQMVQQGQLAFKAGVNQFDLQLAALPAGIYLLEVQEGESVRQIRIAVQ